MVWLFTLYCSCCCAAYFKHSLCCCAGPPPACISLRQGVYCRQHSSCQSVVQLLYSFGELATRWCHLNHPRLAHGADYWQAEWDMRSTAVGAGITPHLSFHGMIYTSMATGGLLVCASACVPHPDRFLCRMMPPQTQTGQGHSPGGIACAPPPSLCRVGFNSCYHLTDLPS